jgi:hypothetical protein
MIQDKNGLIMKKFNQKSKYFLFNVEKSLNSKEYKHLERIDSVQLIEDDENQDI